MFNNRIKVTLSGSTPKFSKSFVYILPDRNWTSLRFFSNFNAPNILELAMLISLNKTHKKITTKKEFY